jgi:hypothetical protein
MYHVAQELVAISNLTTHHTKALNDLKDRYKTLSKDMIEYLEAIPEKEMVIISDGLSHTFSLSDYTCRPPITHKYRESLAKEVGIPVETVREIGALKRQPITKTRLCQKIQ